MFEELLNPSNYFLNPYAIPTLLVGVLILSIGFFVLRQNKNSIINIAFFYKCLAMGFWLFSISFVYSSNKQELAIKLYRNFTFLGVVNIMPSVMFFTMAWSGELRYKKSFVVMNYLVSLLVYVLAITTDKLILPYQMRKYFWGYYPIYTFWVAPYLIFFFAQFIISIRSLYSAYRFEKIPIKKIQKRMVFIALLIAVSASADFLPKFFWLAMYPYGYISMFIYISLVAYAIVRYRAFDIETVIHKTIMWLFTFSFIIIPIFLLHKWLFPHLRESDALQVWFWILSFLLAAFYLRAIQPKIDHLFQRRRSNLEEIAHRFAEDLVHLKGLAQLIPRLEDVLSDTLYSQQISIFIYDEKTGTYKLKNRIKNSEGIVELKADNAFLLWLTKNNKLAYKEFADIDPAYALMKEEAEDYFNTTDSTVVIPLVLNEKLLGIINLGRKSNLRPYSAMDFYFLNTLKNQSAIAISNSLLYENMEDQVRQRTKELVQAQKQLIQAEKLATVGTLAGGVAHEINNPLTAILTNVQMLLALDTALDADSKESLQLIEEATKRCRTIVQKLMTYAKKPLEQTAVAEVDLLNVVNNVVTFLAYQLEQENIRLVTKAQEDSYRIIGNKNELEQVLTNLILNAKDAMNNIKKGGTVYITVSRAQDWIILEVRDEGYGIPQEIISKIFDPFFSTKDVGKGTGLGLSICQSIIEKHNGLINVHSEVNKGSVFTVKLPKAKEMSQVTT
ncbi:MAG: hypothetical protein A3G37_02090 [Omnitrophica WOR_2 bacterium RIFCSPLOWO2_12_FULL_46_30]|nr:MAG: hypothetical protein A3H41_03710 [Omnitrophica WOR_2 bacterium RIFCSPLOWO2_02_FULL_45_28]OGX50335.1 MAG: hypothetical protein A3G37_02090 [Omnitrophica WOR_2 bacterium RIFCSPLOWO2_12_FULL_46_30]